VLSSTQNESPLPCLRTNSLREASQSDSVWPDLTALSQSRRPEGASFGPSTHARFSFGNRYRFWIRAIGSEICRIIEALCNRGKNSGKPLL